MEKYYRVYAQVDMDSIVHNLKEINKIKDSKSELMAIIKADGYGHGAIPVSKVLLNNGADRLGVALAEEGIALRKNNIKAPILILGFTPENQILELLKYDLTQTVFKIEMAEMLSKMAKRHSLTAKIHIKVDTGMGRIGFEPDDESIKAIKHIKSLPNLEIEGIFTHFSRADEIDPQYTDQQIYQFENFINTLEDDGIKIPIKHASNSAGLLKFKNAHYELTRVGIAVYGLYPSKDLNNTIHLKPSLSLKSHIIFLKKVKGGTPISYGGTYIASQDSVIATIPVGYGDGYPRALSSKGRVLINGEHAPIVGRICMDQLMVDVTHIKGVQDGDEVVLIGTQKNAQITVDEIAHLTDTINYEILCGLGKRIPRVYTSKNHMIQSVDYF
ncbi:alanine racemase [Natranaerovirga hydrolytica]|uniref:Alanine racemase n=1 Tax=Natranaerovirga hydrolytica TaxID=680378 RepID=A0A4R1MLY5_9FIRM|nr:alanine racemase [Natranaerovirga hydrolytica]TCK92882.1 alanine racemase [Natranaerovirga hydrolytica]